MERQPYCSWCGKTGKIDLHHVVPRSQGCSDDGDNLVALCHECHMKHHSKGGSRLTFEQRDGVWYGRQGEGAMRPLSVYDESRDAIPTDTEDVLGDLARELRDLKCNADQIDYFLSRELSDAEKRLKGDRQQLAEWCVENLDISPRSVDSYLSKRIAYASLPASCSTLGITNGYKVWLLSQKYPLDDVLHDYKTMSRSQFNDTYGLTKHRQRCTCPECGTVHNVKEADDE